MPKQRVCEVAPRDRKLHQTRPASRVRLAAIVTLAVLAAPLAVAAQTTGKIARIGYLSPLSAPADAAQLEAFRQGLRALDHVEGRNTVIETRHANGSFERLADLAAELARLERVRTTCDA